MRVTIIDDYDVVVDGVARMFARYTDRVRVVSVPSEGPVDIALYDAFAQPTPDGEAFGSLVRAPTVSRAVVYSWNFHPGLVQDALDAGASGYLSKALPARELVDALERIAAGEVVVGTPPRPGRLTVGLDWPGRSEGLSERESEVLALIVQGHSNLQIGERLRLATNTIKTYIRSTYAKIGAADRVAAVLWGVEHGFQPDRHRIGEWAQPATGGSTDPVRGH